MTHFILFMVAVVLILTGGVQGLTSNQAVDKRLKGKLSDNWSANSGAQGQFYLYVFILFFLAIL